jgi:ATP-dependent helicase HrpA
LGAAAAVNFSAVKDPRFHRDGIVAWDCDELPKRIEIQRSGVALNAYPALLDQGESVSLRLLDCPHKATYETRGGLRRLFYLAQRRELKAQADWFPDIESVLLNAATLPDACHFRRCIAELLAERAFLADGSIPRNAQQFQQQMAAGEARIGRAVQEVAALLPPLVSAYHRALLAVESSVGKGWDYATHDTQLQLQHLTSAGFLTRTAWNWLQQYPRYFDALSRRMKKLSEGGVEKDRQLFALIQPRWRAYLDRAQAHAKRGVYDPELIHYRWMLEELRVSLFAQELGTCQPVSPQRLDKQGAKVKA